MENEEKENKTEKDQGPRLPIRTRYPFQYKLISWIALAIISGGLWCGIYFLIGNYSITGLSNAFVVSGAVVLGIGGLYAIAFFGAFDMLVYGTKDIIYHMNPNKSKDPKRYKDYVDYVDDRRTYRRDNPIYFWPYLAFGLSLLLTGIIIRFACL